MPEDLKPAAAAQAYRLLPEDVILHRPQKLTDTQTILYEIDMLNFTASRLEEGNDWQRWCNLECFLLHFRNLIEFFGKQPTRDDLSIQRPENIWTHPATMPPLAQLKHLHREDLWKKYEVREKGWQDDKISRYLQHCTRQRVESKVWRVGVMLEELSPVLEEFESLLPDKHRPWGRPPIQGIVVSTEASFGTATVTRG